MDQITEHSMDTSTPRLAALARLRLLTQDPIPARFAVGWIANGLPDDELERLVNAVASFVGHYDATYERLVAERFGLTPHNAAAEDEARPTGYRRRWRRERSPESG